jgi:putative oxidoreductase
VPAWFGNSPLPVGLIPLRLVLGLVFVMHGYQKLFIFGLSGAAGAFEAMGVPLPQVTSALIAVLELGAGLALILGLLTEWAALGLAGDMLGAILMVKLRGGFFAPQGVEFELALLGGLLTLVLLGRGTGRPVREVAS